MILSDYIDKKIYKWWQIKKAQIKTLLMFWYKLFNNMFHKTSGTMQETMQETVKETMQEMNKTNYNNEYKICNYK